MKRLRRTSASSCCLTALIVASCSTTKRANDSEDGVLSVPEVEAALVRSIIDYSDTNGDRHVSFAEWKAVNADADPLLFNDRDLDGDGRLDRKEVINAAKRSYTWERLIAKIDRNGDGKVDEAEGAAFRAEMDSVDRDDKVNKMREIADDPT